MATQRGRAAGATTSQRPPIPRPGGEAFTTREFAIAAGVRLVSVKHWLESGLLQSNGDLLAGDQIAQARLIQALLDKGVSLGQLAAMDLAFDAGQKFLVFDGRRLRGYADASSAIDAVARVKGRCGVIDLAAVRAV